jgi:hypothetical protein
MSATAVSLPLPAVPPEVEAFAAEQGVRAYLPAVLALARRVYAHRRMAVQLADDPEVADDHRIVIKVDLGGMTVEQLDAAQDQWIEGLFQVCPSTHALLFRIGLL